MQEPIILGIVAHEGALKRGGCSQLFVIAGICQSNFVCCYYIVAGLP